MAASQADKYTDSQPNQNVPTLVQYQAKMMHDASHPLKYAQSTRKARRRPFELIRIAVKECNAIEPVILKKKYNAMTNQIFSRQ